MDIAHPSQAPQYPEYSHSTSVYDLQLSFQSLNVSGLGESIASNDQTTDVDIDIGIDDLTMSMNRSGLYSKPFLGGIPLRRQPFVITHPTVNRAGHSTMQEVIGALANARLSDIPEHLARMRTFPIGSCTLGRDITRACFDWILKGDRSPTATKARIAHLVRTLYSYDHKLHFSRTQSVICGRLITNLDKIAKETAENALKDPRAMSRVQHYRFCRESLREAAISTVESYPLLWDQKVFHSPPLSDDDERILSGALPLPGYTAQFADLYAAAIIEPPAFLHALEKHILPNANSPMLLYIAVFFYASRGLSSRSLKLPPAVWADISSKWDEVSSRFPESQTPGSATWECMQHIKQAIAVLEGDSTIEGLTCSLPFREEPSDGLQGVCDDFMLRITANL